MQCDSVPSCASRVMAHEFDGMCGVIVPFSSFRDTGNFDG